MTKRYFSFEDTGVAYDVDTFTFAANRHDIDVTTEDITPERGHIYPQTSRLRKARRHLLGPNTWTGTIETLLYPTGPTTLLFYALGTNAFTVDMPTLGINTHIVTAADTIPNFISEIGRDDVSHQYVGCVVAGFTMDYAPDAALTASFDINFRKELAPSTLSTIVFDDYDDLDRAFSGVEVDPQLGTAEGGTPTSVTFVESASITVENNFVTLNALKSQFNAANLVEALNVTGSLDIRFDDDTQYTDVVNDTSKELFLTATHGAGSSQRDITVKLTRITYDNTSLTTTDTQRYTQTLDFTSEPDSTSEDVISIEVINALLQVPFEA